MGAPPTGASLASHGTADASFQVDIRVLSADELPAAATILAVGMGDNPLHVKVFGAEPQRRQRRLDQFLGHLVGYVQVNGRLLGAFVDGKLVGVLGMLEPGRCRPDWKETLGFARVVAASNPPTGVWRVGRWRAVWTRNDPSAPHWHLGPLAVAPAYRRRGVGRRLLAQCCEHLDVLAAAAWLETDLAINVAFYETLGFSVVRQESLLGVPNWFMHRPAHGAVATHST
ncbi:MAG TPA: GNAT family N-acetyltransferase [Rhodanobacter sp.]